MRKNWREFENANNNIQKSKKLMRDIFSIKRS